MAVHATLTADGRHSSRFDRSRTPDVDSLTRPVRRAAASANRHRPARQILATHACHLQRLAKTENRPNTKASTNLTTYTLQQHRSPISC